MTSLASFYQVVALAAFFPVVCWMNYAFRHLVGLEETRNPKAGIVETDDWIQVTAACDANGGHGCELWVTKRLPFAWHEDDEPIFCRGPFSCAHPALAGSWRRRTQRWRSCYSG